MAVGVHGALPRALLCLVAIPMLVACAGPGVTPPGSPEASPAASDGPAPSPAGSAGASARLILRITSEGGFVGPAAGLAALPQVSVYADGRIMTPGAVDAIYPAPLLPSVAVRDVGAAGAGAIIAAIRAAGLDGTASFAPGVPGDFGTTVFAVNLDGAVVTTRLVLGTGLPGRPGTGSPEPGIAAAGDLVARLQDLTETWGSTNATTGTLTPTAFRVYVAPGAPASDGTLSPEPAVSWPLATPLATFGTAADPDRGIVGLRQGAVFGADAAALGPLLARANSQTPFMSAGMLYTLYVRPLLPDEVQAPG